MKDHNSAEAVAERASQEDPIVMYLVVHESLGMGMGKTCAQCAHAAQMLQLKYGKLHTELVNRRKHDPVRPTNEELAVKLELIYEQWMNSSFRKVVLRASDKEWEKLKEEEFNNMVMVVDAGLTEIPSGSETVIGLWPIRKSQRTKTVQRLQVLK